MKRTSTRKKTMLLTVAVAMLIPIVLWAQWSPNNNDIYNTNAGNVGIGTSTPQTKLDVNGVVRSTGTNAGVAVWGTGQTQVQIINQAAATDSKISEIIDQLGQITFRTVNDSYTTAQSYLQVVRNTNAHTISNVSFPSGNVGIGTTNPLYKLHLKGQYGTLVWEDPLGTPTAGGLWRLGTGGPNNSWSLQANTAAAGDFSSALQPFTVLGSGNVGIGTATPSAKLDVAGDVVVSGNISAKYQDIAEWVLAAEPIAPGTVVVVDSEGTNTVLPSSHSYDTRVAGVVSATPGITLGEQADGEVKVATTGRVRVRVDASREAIRAGDLLVTSDKEGVAMRSEPVSFGGVEMHRPGTLVGKALESLSEGEGEILVLLSLQ